MAKYTGVTPFGSGWQYRIKLKLDNGKVVDTRIRTDSNGNPFTTARDAYEARRAHELSLREPQTESVPEAPRTLLSDVYADYMMTEAKKKAAATIRKQESMWHNHVCPAFGDRDINSITIVELDSFLFNLYKTHAYAYVEGFLKFFYLLFGHADRMEVIDPARYMKNFVDRGTRLTMPPMTQSDYAEDQEGAVIYTDDEIALMEKIFSREECNLQLAFHLGLYCGLRISECFGLRWKNIDFDQNYITIDRQLQYVDGCFHLSPVKTLAGVRKIYITEEFKEELWFHYSSQLHYRKELKEGYRNTERIYDDIEKRWLDEEDRDFVNRKKNGEMLTINSMKYWARVINPELKKMAEDRVQLKKLAWAGITLPTEYKEFKYHNLRHTFASRCALQNVPIFVLMQMLGHKKIDTTKKYYINVDDDYVADHTRKILGQLYK